MAISVAKGYEAAISASMTACRSGSTVDGLMNSSRVNPHIRSILPLGQQLATTPVDSQAPMRAIADALLSIREHSTLAAVFALSVAALMYYTLLHRARLLPRWLTGWGIAGALLILTACLLSLFTDNPVTGYTLFILPLAVQEMLLAGWLLVKGFNPWPPTSTTGPRSVEHALRTN